MSQSTDISPNKAEHNVLHSQDDGSTQTVPHADALACGPNKQPFLQQLHARMAARREVQRQQASTQEDIALHLTQPPPEPHIRTDSKSQVSPDAKAATSLQAEAPASMESRMAHTGLSALRALPSPSNKKRGLGQSQPKSWGQLVKHMTPCKRMHEEQRTAVEEQLGADVNTPVRPPQGSPLYIMPSAPPSSCSYETNSPSPGPPGHQYRSSLSPCMATGVVVSQGQQQEQGHIHQLEAQARIKGRRKPRTQSSQSPARDSGDLAGLSVVQHLHARANLPGNSSSADQTADSSEGQTRKTSTSGGRQKRQKSVSSGDPGKQRSKVARVVYPPGVFAQLPGEDPRISLWHPPPSPFSLLEEVLYDNPWALLLACILLNKTSGMQVRRALGGILRAYPTPHALAAAGGPADQARLQQLLHPLGLYKSRAARLVRFSQEYLNMQWSDPRQLHGVGQYGSDAYAMFCRGAWQQMPAPADKDLRKYWEWLHATGGHGEGLQRESLQQILTAAASDIDIADVPLVEGPNLPDSSIRAAAGHDGTDVSAP